MLCLKSSESTDHIFLHYTTTLALWQRLFCLANLDCIPPRRHDGNDGYLFGNLQKGKILWWMAILSLIWFIWLERNARIFKDRWGSFFYFLLETKNVVLIVVKIQKKDERSFAQNTEFGQSRNTPLYRKLYTKIISNYLKLLNHELQSSWVVKH